MIHSFGDKLEFPSGDWQFLAVTNQIQFGSQRGRMP